MLHRGLSRVETKAAAFSKVPSVSKAQKKCEKRGVRRVFFCSLALAAFFKCVEGPNVSPTLATQNLTHEHTILRWRWYIYQGTSIVLVLLISQR